MSLSLIYIKTVLFSWERKKKKKAAQSQICIREQCSRAGNLVKRCRCRQGSHSEAFAVAGRAPGCGEKELRLCHAPHAEQGLHPRVVPRSPLPSPPPAAALSSYGKYHSLQLASLAEGKEPVPRQAQVCHSKHIRARAPY